MPCFGKLFTKNTIRIVTSSSKHDVICVQLPLCVTTITSMRKLMCLNVWLSLGNQINNIIGVLAFACSVYSRCGSWTFTWTFFAVTRCSVGGITIKTIQTDLAVKASSVVRTILSTNKLGSFLPVL